MDTNTGKSAKEIHESREKMWDSSIAYHKKYINSTTGLFDEKYLERRVCPVCESNQQRFLFTKEGGQYVKCVVCEMVYLNPVFTDAALNDFYTNNHNVQAEIVENDSPFYNKIYGLGLKMALKHLRQKKSHPGYRLFFWIFSVFGFKRWLLNNVWC